MNGIRGVAAWIIVPAAIVSILPAAEPAKKPKPAGSGRSFSFDFPDLGPPSIGVTRQGTPMESVGVAGPYEDARPRVAFVFRQAEEADFELFAEAILDEKGVVWSAVVVNPDGKRGSDENRSGGNPTRGYPPQGGYYDDPKNPEARYLWRWLGMYAPDLVVEVVWGGGETWYAPKSDLPQLAELRKRLPKVKELPDSDELVPQLVKTAPGDVGVIPAVRVVTGDSKFVGRILKIVKEMKLPPSAARLEIQKRLQRTPQQTAEQLLEVYGKQLSAVQYIPALALVGRLRHERNVGGERTPVSPIVLQAVEPYVSNKKPTTDAKSGGSGFAGHLVFGELADLTGDKRYVALIKAVADRAFDDQGRPLPAMPAHNEMSDAVFMGCPILAQAGKHTGDAKYFDACLRNLRFMQKLCLRDDGIYRNSPLDEAAWGRGNGFPALGLTWSLDELPQSFAGRAEIAAALEKHLTALLKHQDSNGCWHQVIDKPESYAEFTCTAMITYAMARGVRLGRLDAKTYDGAIRRGWYALKTRIAADGTLFDVCTGTGKQTSLRGYYDRPAILGRDDRGGAMALMLATEMELYLQAKP